MGEDGGRGLELTKLRRRQLLVAIRVGDSEHAREYGLDIWIVGREIWKEVVERPHAARVERKWDGVRSSTASRASNSDAKKPRKRELEYAPLGCAPYVHSNTSNAFMSKFERRTNLITILIKIVVYHLPRTSCSLIVPELSVSICSNGLRPTPHGLPYYKSSVCTRGRVGRKLERECDQAIRNKSHQNHGIRNRNGVTRSHT